MEDVDYIWRYGLRGFSESSFDMQEFVFMEVYYNSEPVQIKHYMVNKVNIVKDEQKEVNENISMRKNLLYMAQ